MEATKTYASINGTDYLRFTNLKVGNKRYEVVLALTSTTSTIEVYKVVKNQPAEYLAHVAPALMGKLHAAMERVS